MSTAHINDRIFAAVSGSAPSVKSPDCRSFNARGSSNSNRAALLGRTASASQHESQLSTQSQTQCQTPTASKVHSHLRAQILATNVSETSSTSVTGPLAAATAALASDSHLQTPLAHTHHAMHEMSSTTGTAANAESAFYAMRAPQDNSSYRNMQSSGGAGSQTLADPQQTLADPQFTPTARSDSSLSLPSQDSADSNSGPSDCSSAADEAESSRPRDLNTPEHRQRSALAFNRVISELRQQQGGAQLRNGRPSSAASSVYGKDLEPGLTAAM